MILSFSGGSWIGICYYFGVISYLSDHFRNTRIITLGASAGAWAAAAIQLRHKLDVNHIKRVLYQYMDSLPRIPHMCEPGIRKIFDQTFSHITDDDVAEIGNNLHISVTVWNNWRYRNEIRTGFKTVEELKEAIIHSSRVPGFIGYDPRNIDGGFTNNQPVLGLDTIKICCIYIIGGDICPKEKTNPIYFLIPPPLSLREKLGIMGYHDTRDYFENLFDIISIDDDDDHQDDLSTQFIDHDSEFNICPGNYTGSP